MKTSIIIPVKNDNRILRCVQSILNQLAYSESSEIIIVDNNSTSINVRNLLKNLPVKIYVEERPGLAAAVNCGLIHATGEYLVRIDADCLAEDNWLEELLKPFSDTRIGAVGGAVLKENGTSMIEIASRGLVVGDQYEPQYLPMFDAPYVVTANAAYRMNVIRQIGGFDDEFISGSDVDISWRIILAKYLICTAPRAVVYHPSRPTVRKYFYQFYNYGLGHALLFKKYKKITGKRLLINVYPFRGIIHLIFIAIPRIFLNMITRDKNIKIQCMKVLLDFTEYFALICGDIIGAIRLGIFYF